MQVTPKGAEIRDVTQNFLQEKRLMIKIKVSSITAYSRKR